MLFQVFDPFLSAAPFTFYHASKQSDVISVSRRGQVENDAKLLFYSPQVAAVKSDKHISSDEVEGDQHNPVTLTSCGVQAN